MVVVMTYTVGEVARATGVTVRTLHHYDEIGVLNPSSRSASGYRLYGEGDLERLQEILFFRQLAVKSLSIHRFMAVILRYCFNCLPEQVFRFNGVNHHFIQFYHFGF